MGEMLFIVAAVNQDIIKVSHNTSIAKWSQYLIHQPREHTQGIAKTKRHNLPFKDAVLYFERCFLFVTGLDLNLAVATM